MKRLDHILSLIHSDVGIVDVGTDHGILPASLAVKGYTGNLFATDIHASPLNAAKKQAEAVGVAGRIRFLLSNGLDEIDSSEVDSIVIAGLGGDLICSILDRAEWTMDSAYEILLQPMTKAEVLRFWLCNNGYEIQEEHLVQENGRLFRILSVRFSGSNTPMTDGELYLGKPEKVHNKDLFGLLLQQEKKRMEKKLSGLLASEKREEARFFGQILAEFVRIEENQELRKGNC